MRPINLRQIGRSHVVRETAAHSRVPDLGHLYVQAPKTGQVFKATASQVAQAKAAAATTTRAGRARHVRVGRR